MIDDPITNPAAWYAMKIAGVPTPGKVEVEAARVNRINKMMGLGADGASTVYVGREIVEATCTFWAWQTAHFTAWDSILALMKYNPAKGFPVRAVDCYHPALAELDVRAMLCEKLTTWKHEGNGLYSRTLTLIEYKPVPKSAAYGKPFSAPGDEGETDPQIKALKNQLADVSKEAQQAYAP